MSSRGYIVPVRASVVAEWPCEGRVSCPVWVPPCSELPGEAPATHDPDLDQQIRKELFYLFVFIFLKLCIAHVHLNIYN